MNYIDTFILVADDCPAESGIIPIVKEGKHKPIHAILYELLAHNPYKLTQEKENLPFQWADVLLI